MLHIQMMSVIYLFSFQVNFAAFYRVPLSVYKYLKHNCYNGNHLVYQLDVDNDINDNPYIVLSILFSCSKMICHKSKLSIYFYTLTILFDK